ncbi:hypothetical protein C8035_v007414 [Colletotrichum spinosum]|uniref:Uncharacterized protein n=1 Tax=Colletotrichum spinosum TaxID=1347390 RepID=A0A4R8PS86_9PEZI|nr:hypothetical protein C8035_v007414 [Colletotrichum spinosum]
MDMEQHRKGKESGQSNILCLKRFACVKWHCIDMMSEPNPISDSKTNGRPDGKQTEGIYGVLVPEIVDNRLSVLSRCRLPVQCLANGDQPPAAVTDWNGGPRRLLT